MLEKEKLVIDPRTKILFCILINGVIYSYIDKMYIMLFIAFAMLMLLYYKKYNTIKLYILVYLFIFTFEILTPFFPMIIVRILTPTIISLQMFLPFIIFGALLIKTSKISDVANVLDKIHCPNVLLIPFLVLLRFFPTVTQEIKNISNAMKLRNLNFGLKSFITRPMKTVEYLYVPLLYSMVKLGNELTVASLTRGLGSDEQRTYKNDVRFHIVDLVLIIIFVLLMIISFVLGKGS